MKKTGQRNNTDFLAGMIVLAIFAAGIIAALLSGAGAYRRLTQRDESEYEARICTQYIATRISGAESADAVTIEQPDGTETPVLRIRETVGEEKYDSYIYISGGWICELYTSEEYAPDFTAGERLVQAQGMKLSMEGNLVTARITTESGEERTVCVCIGESSGEGAAA